MKLFAFSAFVMAALLTVSTSLISASSVSDPDTAHQAGSIGVHEAFEYALILDASEIEWFGCSWAEFRC